MKKLYQKYLKCNGICTDTRKIDEESLFFALKGPNFDANEYAQEAIDKGAKYAVIDNAKFAINDRFLLVDNVLDTLQSLAQYHRNQLDIPLIAITGSNGKTTTKELAYEVLATKFNTLATKGNLNNHIGVPLTILSIDSTFEIAIIEMGANHLGDIAQLCQIAKPTHGVITNIGRAHIGEFGGYDNILRTKSELYQYLIDTDGQVWINSSQKVLKNMSKRFRNSIFYPNKGDNVECNFLSASPFITYSHGGNTINTQLVGSYNFDNIAAALAIGFTFGVSAGEAHRAIASYQPQNNRSQIIKKGSNTYLLDAYNANPSSMEVAIENISQMQAQQKVLILGDMYELGNESLKEHKAVGDMVKDKGFTQVYFCGIEIKNALSTYPKAKYFEEKESLINDIRSQNFANTLFLLKASRGMELESIIDEI